MWLLSTFLLYLTIIGTVKSSIDYLQHPVKSCHVGDAIENTCNKCLCTSKTVFECTPLGCNSTITNNELEETEPVCVPNQLYVQNLITCICTKDGRWPHKSCKDTFQSLPPRNVITHTCEPDTYIPIDCNVCRCGPDGKIHNDRCTRNACEDDIQRRSSYMSSNSLFSKCEEKYWYSLAPCQFCFCVNEDKLVCNTGNYYTRNLDLGSYKLNICGKDLIKEAIELIPDTQRTLRSTNSSKNQIQNPLTHITSNNVRQKVPKNHNMNIEFVPVINTKKNPIQAIKSVNMSKDYYSEKLQVETQHEEKKQTPLEIRSVATTSSTVLSTRGIPIGRIQLQNDGERAGVKGVNGIEDDDESIGIEIDFAQSLTTETTLRAHSEERKVKPYEYEGETLKINIPKALNKVFQLAVRKSMVTLSKNTKCKPGATTVHECNMCFCLKNTKLLCTSHKCDGKKSLRRN